MTTQYRQRDGKTVLIDPRGIGKRFLPSGEADPQPLAGLEGGWERTWYELMGRRALDDKPLTAEDIAFARPTPETIVALNRARADWQKVAFALRDALEDTSGEVLERIEMAAGQMELDLWLFEFVEDANAETHETRRLGALIAAVNSAAGWLRAAVANIAEAAPPAGGRGAFARALEDGDNQAMLRTHAMLETARAARPQR